MDSTTSERINNYTTTLENFLPKNEKLTVKGEEYDILCSRRFAGCDTSHLVVLDMQGVPWLLIVPPEGNDSIFYKMTIDNKKWYSKSMDS